MRFHDRVFAVVLAMALLGTGSAQAQDMRNWFDDPFFQITSALPDCPLPAGPFTPESERAAQAHHRAERGTTCWLAGQCERPNDYAYDADIATAVRGVVSHAMPESATTLWVTVQGRIVYIEGCASHRAAVDALEERLRAVSYVRQVVSNVRTDPKAPLPYRPRSTP
jgi:hypothetical protein